MISEDVLVIAEMANVHEGELASAKDIVDAISSSADAIKFQVFSADELVLPSHPDYDVFSRLEMSDSEWGTLVDYARDAGLCVFADVFGRESVDTMTELGVGAFKIHNADVSNSSLLDYVGRRADSVLLSAGGSTKVELSDALNQLDTNSTLLMYGYQNYPTSVEDSNLHRIQALREKFDIPVGYASHAPGGLETATELPKLAVAAGGTAIEVHVTLDRSEGGTDHYSSLEPDEFDEMVRNVRSVEQMLGLRTLDLPESEREYRRDHKKWLVATGDIQPGEEFMRENVGYRRLSEPPRGKNLREEMVLDRIATEELTAGEQITFEHMETKVAATLACRAESTRLYGKPMQRVGENAILDHLVTRLGKVEQIDEIVLAIADTPSKDAFIDYANAEDLDFIVGSEENVLGRLIEAGEYVDADLLVRATTENPFVYYQNVDDLIDSQVENNCDLTLTRNLPMGTSVEVVSLQALRSAQKHGEDRHRSELCTLFIVENPDSFDIHAEDPPEEIARPDVRLTVDNPEDLVVARSVWDNVTTRSDDISLESIIEYLDRNPEVKESNAHLPDGTDDDVKTVRPFMYGNEPEE